MWLKAKGMERPVRVELVYSGLLNVYQRKHRSVLNVNNM